MTFISFLSSIICPLEEDGAQLLQDDETWRIVFATSAVLSAVTSIVVALFFDVPSLRDLVLQNKGGDQSFVNKELLKIYEVDDDMVLETIKQQIIQSHESPQDQSKADQEKEQLTFKDAYFSAKYRFAHWNSFILAAS